MALEEAVGAGIPGRRDSDVSLQVPQSLERLSQEIDRLHSLLEKLEERVVPVSLPTARLVSEGKPQPEATRAPISELLENHTHGVIRACERVGTILDELQV